MLETNNKDKANCTGCQIAYINGVRCHETGCPEAWKDYTRTCIECGFDFRPGDKWESMCIDCRIEILSDYADYSEYE